MVETGLFKSKNKIDADLGVVKRFSIRVSMGRKALHVGARRFRR